MILLGKSSMQINENGKKRFGKEKTTLKYFHCLKDKIRKAERLKTERGKSWHHRLEGDKAMGLSPQIGVCRDLWQSDSDGVRWAGASKAAYTGQLLTSTKMNGSVTKGLDLNVFRVTSGVGGLRSSSEDPCLPRRLTDGLVCFCMFAGLFIN